MQPPRGGGWHDWLSDGAVRQEGAGHAFAGTGGGPAGDRCSGDERLRQRNGQRAGQCQGSPSGHFGQGNWAPQATVPGAWNDSLNQTKVTWCLQGGCPGGPTDVIPGADNVSGPALAFLRSSKGTLYVAWRTPASGVVDFSASVDGGTFTAAARLSKALTGEAPALAAQGSTLYAAWRGTGTNHQVWYSSATKPT
ncbi:MAG TPA: hypothetical protein VGS19_05325 [Streptosporangiaceae bacterium]|nr:hypothetical protein [Streptosporangiaceae bacterium]